MLGFKEFLEELTTSAKLNIVAKNISGMRFADKLNDYNFIKILSVILSIDPTVTFPADLQLKSGASPEDIYAALVATQVRQDGVMRHGVKVKAVRQIGGDFIEWIYTRLENNEFAITEIGKHANMRRALILYPKIRHLHAIDSLDIPGLFLATENLLTKEEEGQIDTVLKKSDVEVVDRRGKYMLIRCDSVAAIRAVGNATPNIWCVRGLGQAHSYYDTCKRNNKHFFYIVKDGMLRYAIGGGDGISDIANRSVTRDNGISILKEDLDYLRATQKLHEYEICKQVNEIADPTEHIQKTLDSIKSDYFSSTVLGDLAVLQREFQEYPELLQRLKHRRDSEGLVLYASILARRGPNNPLDAESEDIIARNPSEIIDYISSVYKRLSDKTKKLEAYLIEAYEDNNVHFDEISDYVSMLRKVGREPDDKLIGVISNRMKHADMEMLKDLVNLGLNTKLKFPDELIERVLYRFNHSDDVKFVTENFNIPVEKIREVLLKSTEIEGSAKILLCHAYGIEDPDIKKDIMLTVRYLYNMQHYDARDMAIIKAEIEKHMTPELQAVIMSRMGQTTLKDGDDAALLLLSGTKYETQLKKEILSTIAETITGRSHGSVTVASYVKYLTSIQIGDLEYVKTLVNTLTRDGFIDHAKAICKHEKIKYGSVVDELNAEIYSIIRENRDTYNPTAIKTEHGLRDIITRTIELIPSLSAEDVLGIINGLAKTEDVPDDLVKRLIETFVATKKDAANFIHYLGAAAIKKFVSKDTIQKAIDSVKDGDSAYRMFRTVENGEIAGVNVDTLVTQLMKVRNYHAVTRLIRNKNVVHTITPELMFRIYCGTKDYATAIQYAKDNDIPFEKVLKRFKAVRTARNIPIVDLLNAGMNDEQLHEVISRIYKYQGRLGELAWALRRDTPQSIKDRYVKALIDVVMASTDDVIWTARSILQVINEYANNETLVKHFFNVIGKKPDISMESLLNRAHDMDGVLRKYVDALKAKIEKSKAKAKTQKKEEPAKKFDIHNPQMENALTDAWIEEKLRTDDEDEDEDDEDEDDGDEVR